jgi:hypothetical protein
VKKRMKGKSEESAPPRGAGQGRLIERSITGFEPGRSLVVAHR